MTAERDITKLPRWAQHEIERLRANADHYQRKFEEAEKNMLKRGLLDIGNGKRIDWLLRVDGEIEISAYDGEVQILPRASNSITIRVRRFGER